MNIFICIYGTFAFFNQNILSSNLNKSILFAGEGNGNPLQYPCLENVMDRGAWWAAVMGSERVGHD